MLGGNATRGIQVCMISLGDNPQVSPEAKLMIRVLVRGGLTLTGLLFLIHHFFKKTFFNGQN